MGWYGSNNGYVAQTVSELLESTGTTVVNGASDCYPLGRYPTSISPILPNVTICTTNPTCYAYNNGCYSFNTVANNVTRPSICVTGDAEFEGDVKIKGVNICEVLNKIESRLAILQPDPKKLEHFEALKKAYDHYKVLEALCELPDKEDDE